MADKTKCPYCGRNNIVKRGFRKLKRRKNEVAKHI